MQLCSVATLSQRGCVGRVTKYTQQLCDKGKVWSSVCAIQHRSSTRADFPPKLTTTITVTETEYLSKLTLLDHLLTNPLGHGDPAGQHDHGVQVLADVFVTCSTESQSPSQHEVREINCRLSWDLAINIDR